MVRVSAFFISSMIKFSKIFVQIFVENIFYILCIDALVYLADNCNYFRRIILRFVSRCWFSQKKKKRQQIIIFIRCFDKFPFLKKLHRFVSLGNETEARFLQRKRTFGWKRKEGERKLMKFLATQNAFLTAAPLRIGELQKGPFRRF